LKWQAMFQVKKLAAGGRISAAGACDGLARQTGLAAAGSLNLCAPPSLQRATPVARRRFIRARRPQARERDPLAALSVAILGTPLLKASCVMARPLGHAQNVHHVIAGTQQDGPPHGDLGTDLLLPVLPADADHRLSAHPVQHFVRLVHPDEVVQG